MADTEFRVGDRVSVHGNLGVVRFFGTASFATGKWVGIELDIAEGKNDGSVKDVRYFQCKPNHGMFVRPVQVTLVAAAATEPTSAAVSPPSTAETASAAAVSASVPTYAALPARATTPSATPASEPSASTSVLSLSSDVSAEPASVLTENAPASEKEPESRDSEVTETKPIEPVAPTTLSFSSTTVQQTVPLKLYEDLQVKLKFFESKKLEDREKLKEVDKLRSENQMLSSIRQKQDETVKELQKQLKDLRKEFSDYREEKEQNESSVSELAESVELLTVDKEMAEERADLLQTEVDSLKERVEELSLELEILRNEKSEGAEGSGASRAELEQLEKQNERLKEALVKLRDVTTEEKAELSRKVKELEKSANEVPSLTAKVDKLKKENHELLEQVTELKDQLEAASAAADMIEELGNQKMAMEDRLAELQATVEDLESLRQLNEELEENHVEAEKQLQAEIEYKDSVIARQQSVIETNQETHGEYEQTISKFRDLVQQLQNELEEARSKETGAESAVLSNQSQSMQSLKLELQSSMTKAQAKAVALDLRRLDAEQANDHLAYLMPFLPQLFFDSEHENIKTMLSLKRILFKGELILKYVEQVYRIDQGKKGNEVASAEEMLLICQLRAKVAAIVNHVRRLYLFAQTCSTEEYVAIVNWKGELQNVERRVDSFVELVRKEELNEAVSLQDLSRAVTQLEALTASAITATSIATEHTTTPLLQLQSDLLESGADATFVELRYFYGVLQPNVLDPNDRRNLIEPLQDLQKINKSIQVLAKKLQRRLNDVGQHPYLTSPAAAKTVVRRLRASTLLPGLKEQESKFGLLRQLLRNVINTLPKPASDESVTIDVRAVCESIIQHSSTLLGVVVTTNQEEEEDSPPSVWQAVLEWTRAQATNLQQLLDESLKDENIDQSVTLATPWQQKAEAMRAYLAVNPALNKKIEQQQQEIIARVTDVKQRDQKLDEYIARIELLEGRFSNLTQKHESELAAWRNQEKIYTQAIETLQKDLDQLENERNQPSSKKQTSKTHEKKPSTTSMPTPIIHAPVARLAASIDSPITPAAASPSLASASPSNDGEVVDGLVVQQLRHAIRYLQHENSRLRSRVTNTVLSKAVDKHLAEVLQESQRLLKDLESHNVSALVVQVDDHSTTQWKPMAEKPAYKLYAHRAAMAALQHKSEVVQRKLRDLLDKHQSIASSKTNDRGNGPLCARIRLPSSATFSSSSSVSTRAIAVDTTALMRFHTVFAL